MARLESEKEKDRVAVERRLEEKTLTVLGDIEPQFQEVGLCVSYRCFDPFLKAGSWSNLKLARLLAKNRPIVPFCRNST